MSILTLGHKNASPSTVRQIIARRKGEPEIFRQEEISQMTQFSLKNYERHFNGRGSRRFAFLCCRVRLGY